MPEQTQKEQSSFAGYYDEPEYPLYINSPRGKLLRGFLYHAIAMFLLTLFSFGIIWGFSTPVFVFFIIKHHALSKVWTAYKYSRFLFWCVTIIMLILFFVSSYFIRMAAFELIDEIYRLS